MKSLSATAILQLDAQLKNFTIDVHDDIYAKLSTLDEIFSYYENFHSPKSTPQKCSSLLQSLSDQLADFRRQWVTGSKLLKENAYQKIKTSLLNNIHYYRDLIQHNPVPTTFFESSFSSTSSISQSQQSQPKYLSERCRSCGGQHQRRFCRFLKSVCAYCHKTGHLQSVCEQKTRPRPKTRPNTISSAIAFTLSSDSQSLPSDCWIVDSGATQHLTSNFQNLINPSPYHTSVYTANQQLLNVTHIGNVTILLSDTSNQQRKITLLNVLYSTDIAHNFLSVGRLTAKGGTLTIDDKPRITLKGMTFPLTKAPNNLLLLQSLPVNAHLSLQQLRSARPSH